MGNIAQVVDDAGDLEPRLFRDIFFLINDAGDGFYGNASFFGDIVQGCRQLWLPFKLKNQQSILTTLSDSVVRILTELNDNVNRENG